METYIIVPILKKQINNIYDINNKLNILNEYFSNKLYDNFSFNIDNEELEISSNYNKTKNKRINKNYIEKATFYIKISDKNNIIFTGNTELQKNLIKCPICYDLILDKNKYLKLICKHVFCKECYNIWNEKCSSNNICTSCPMCREIVN